MSFLSTLFSRRLSPPPLIVLLTDFGRADQYVGVMKGVIASINPHAKVIDLSHEVGAQAIRQGAYLLWAAYRFFPEGTTFVAVVDPGVGSDRRILAVRTARSVFLAPDNGLLDFILHDQPATECSEVRLHGSPFVLREISTTFHGRDIFAPVAAYLSAGVSLAEVGIPVTPPVPANPFVESKGSKGAAVVHIDRFGNIVTNVALRGAHGLIRALSVKNIVVQKWIRTYQEAPARQPCLIEGSSGLVEVVIKNGSAAGRLGVSLTTPLKVHWK